MESNKCQIVFFHFQWEHIFTLTNSNLYFLEKVYFQNHLFQLVIDHLPSISFDGYLSNLNSKQFNLNYFSNFNYSYLFIKHLCQLEFTFKYSVIGVQFVRSTFCNALSPLQIVCHFILAKFDLIGFYLYFIIFAL